MKKIFSGIALLFILLPAFSLAADFRMDSVSKSDKVRNLYVAGENVNVDADVAGDLTAAGNVLTVNGDVAGSANLAGSTVNIKSKIGGNARVAAGTVNIDGNIGEDLVVFGGQVTLGKDASVARDLVIMGGTVIVNGKVGGKIYGSCGDLNIAGSVSDDVELKNTGKITLSDSALIGGKLVYSAQQKQNIDESKVKGGVQFTQVDQKKEQMGRVAMKGLSIFGIIGAIIVLFVLTQLAPKSAQKVVETAFANPWANIGIGFVTLAVVPVILLALAITVFGLPLAGLGFLAYILLLVLSGLFSGLVVGSWLTKFFKKQDKYQIGWLEIIVGVIVIGLFKVVPLVGWMIGFLFFLLTLGSITKNLFETSKGERQPATK